jgi:hypothetical protein
MVAISLNFHLYPRSTIYSFFKTARETLLPPLYNNYTGKKQPKNGTGCKTPFYMVSCTTGHKFNKIEQSGIKIKMKLRAHIVKHSSDYVPSMQALRSPLCVDLYVEDKSGGLPDSTYISISALELFTNTSRNLEEELTYLPEDGQEPLRLLIPAEILPMGAGCWHIVFDIISDGKSLLNTDVGAAVTYLREPGESLYYTRAGFNLARAELAYDRPHENYWQSYPARFPATGDPFNEEHLNAHPQKFDFGTEATPEDLARGGKGFLQAACVYAVLDDDNRLMYCEEVIDRIVNKLSDKLPLPNKGQSGSKETVKKADVENRSVALKFLSQLYFYYDNGPGDDRKKAKHIIAIAKGIFKEQLQLLDASVLLCSQNTLSRLTSLDSLLWYCLAHKSEHGQFYNPDVGNKIIDETRKMADKIKQPFTKRREECPALQWEEQFTLLDTLTTAYRMAKEQESHGGNDIAKTLAEAVMENIERMESGVSKTLLFISDAPRKLSGDLYELLSERFPPFVPQKTLTMYARVIVQSMPNSPMTRFADLNACGAMLQGCREYRGLKDRPHLPWNME